MFCCLQSSDERDPSFSALQSLDESDGSGTDTSSQRRSTQVVLHCVASSVTLASQGTKQRNNHYLLLYANVWLPVLSQSSSKRSSKRPQPDESPEVDLGEVVTSQAGDRQSNEDSAAENEDSEESEEERSQDDNVAAGLFVRLAKGERKKLKARESLLLDTLRRAKSDRWSELCSRVVVSDALTEHT